MSNEVKLILTAEDNISSTIKKVTEYLGDSGLGQGITAVSTSFMALNQVLDVVGNAFNKVFDTISAGVMDAAEAENINKRLALSMASVGQYTESSFIELQSWSGALETATGVSDDALRSLVALGIQQGMNAEQAKKAAEAAMNLAAATGQDMNTAFQQMSMTLQGASGRLGRMVPELKNLTKEELENGAAIDLIAKKYEGFAGQTANSFIGASTRIDTQIGNIKENFGRMIAQNPAIIAMMNDLADSIQAVGDTINEFSTWVLNNSEDLKILAISFGIASAAVLAYVAYQNAATIATVAFKVAQIALNSAMALTPWGAAIAAVTALTAGIYYLYKNFDLVAGAVKVGLGYALNAVTFQLQMFLTGIGKVVGFFNEEWGNAIQSAVTKIDAYSKHLIDSGNAQMELAKQSKKTSDQLSTDAMTVQRSIAGIENKIQQTEQEIQALEGAFSKAMESAKTAFSGVQDFMPRMKLEKFNEDAVNWQKQIDTLKTQAEALKIKLSVDVQSEEAKAELQKIEQQLRFASEAEKALKIKSAIESREAVLKEEQIRLDQMKAKSISVEQEIGMMRLEQARATRSQLIELETQRILEQRGLASAADQEGISVKQAAALKANEVELSAFKNRLEAEKALAVDIELQKQLELAQVKAAAMNQNTAGGASAQNDVELIQAQMKQAELARLRDQDLLSENQYQEQLTALRIAQIQSRNESEVMMNKQKMDLLGTSPEALALALENEKIRAEQEQLILQEKLMSKQLTEEEYRIASEEAEKAHLERDLQTKEQFAQREADLHKRMGNSWEALLANIRAQQAKHGQLMGAIKAVQASEEYAATQKMFSDLSSLRSSSDRKAFEAGKAAAIAQTTINTFMSATAAYSALAGIPIVGPALAVAAAAAAIAAGINNVSQIKSQKFQGGAHGGLDEVPKSMNNSTFVLKAGERVVQPEQNVELGKAIDKINNGQTGGGHTINITVQGNADDSAINKMKEAVIDAIREASERGTPIMNEKGIVRN